MRNITQIDIMELQKDAAHKKLRITKNKYKNKRMLYFKKIGIKY